jgi:NAD+ synthase (glutamine-hydrolysing)
MAQINLLVGDIDGNAQAVIDATRRSEQQFGADIVVFPELTLTGYPPEDLLLRPSLQKRVSKALQRILEARLAATVVLGLPVTEGGKLFNSLLVIGEGRVLGSYHKQCLPNYQVFDEERYFEAGHAPLLVDPGGVLTGFTICEDLWEPGPARQLSEAGASLMININASPFHINKINDRRELLKQRATDNKLAIVYVNTVGGQDELVFDGGSMAVNQQGDLQVAAPPYQEGLFPLEITPGATLALQPQNPSLVPQAVAPSAEESVYQALVLGMRDYVNKNRFPSVVLGLSGGIDSALTLAIAVDALGADRVEAVMMPFAYTSQLSLDASREQAARLGVSYKVIAIEPVFNAFMQALSDEFASAPRSDQVDVTEQNLQARCRGVLLMAISNKKGSLVLTTGNKSEIAVGYSTLYGDMAGGFDALKDVAKTLVYRLSRYRNSLEAADRPVIPVEVIERPPSAELAPGQEDQDSLPPYDVLDDILERYIEKDESAADIIRAGFAADVVHRVIRLVDLNEYKRRQSPVGVRLTRRGFGRDRRYPITNAWSAGE